MCTNEEIDSPMGRTPTNVDTMHEPQYNQASVMPTLGTKRTRSWKGNTNEIRRVKAGSARYFEPAALGKTASAVKRSKIVVQMNGNTYEWQQAPKRAAAKVCGSIRSAPFQNVGGFRRAHGNPPSDVCILSSCRQWSLCSPVQFLLHAQTGGDD